MGGSMRLKNKRTGEIIAVESISSLAPTLVADKKTIQLTGTNTETGYRKMYRYESLTELNEEWEDVPEEPKEYWWIDTGSIPMVRKSNNPVLSTTEDIDKEIGNYFETKEEAELAVRKLKAWKRLKSHDLFISKGNRTFVNVDDVFVVQNVQFRIDTYGDVEEDLDLLFSQEDD